MKIKLLKNYQLSERGMIVDFPDGISKDLIRRRIAEDIPEIPNAIKKGDKKRKAK